MINFTLSSTQEIPEETLRQNCELKALFWKTPVKLQIERFHAHAAVD
jgi:hypothetical protein